MVLCLSTPVLLIRLYTRKVINHKLWWRQPATAYLLCRLFAEKAHADLARRSDMLLRLDIWNVSNAQHVRFTKVHKPWDNEPYWKLMSSQLFHNIEIVARIGMFFTKASILLLYHRLFIVDGSKKTGTWWAIWSVFWYNLLYALALVSTVITQCVGQPTAIVERGKCLNQYAVLICASVINVISDLMILTIPITVILGLQKTKSKKIRLSFLFAFGSLGVIASLGRLDYQVHEAKRPNQTVIVMVLSMLK
ncbi:MAG: hypothetical protein Q9215_004765 [Flavoplaca cf. flavocitrina]